LAKGVQRHAADEMNISEPARRVWRNLLFLMYGNEPYYSAERWDRSYLEGYNLDVCEQDARYGSLVSLLLRYDSGLPILDVGCGDGVLAEKFRRVSESRIVGIDYSEQAIKLAVAKNIQGGTFICSDYRSCDLQETFGIIVANESLYYINDAVPVLKKLCQFLSRNGVLIVSMYDAFDNRHIWTRVLKQFCVVRSLMVSDETYGKQWQIRVLRPIPGLAFSDQGHGATSHASGPANERINCADHR
jgi:2-polyprenyl-3-methyl-5-hydroxy-6-metoxy-1,4-benzoquinol methylase